jgi:hypothetical protein
MWQGQVFKLDALMCARRLGSGVTLIAFEWKYLDSYGPESRATSSRGTDRVAMYSAAARASGRPDPRSRSDAYLE